MNLLFSLFFQAAFEDEEESQYFDSEDVFQQLNYEANDFGDDSGSDRDDDLVCFSDCYRPYRDVGSIFLERRVEEQRGKGEAKRLDQHLTLFACMYMSTLLAFLGS